MSDLNVCALTGNLTADPEIRYTPKGTPVCDFTLAVNTGFGDNQKTSFIGMTSWGKVAENMQKYLGKGSKVSVHGRISQESWESEGKKRSKTKVIVEQLNFLNSKKREQADAHAPRPAPAQEPAPAEEEYEDDIPF